MAFPAPSLEPPALEDFQFSFNGLTFGAGTPYAVLKLEGISLPDVRNGDVNWPRDHGQAEGLDLLGGQDMLFDLWVKTDGTSLQHAQEVLAKATAVRPSEEIPLWFKLPNLNIMCRIARPRLRKGTVDTDYAAANIWQPELLFHATDPRLYEQGAETSIALGALAGGKVTPGTHSFTNGNTEMRPILILTGKLLNPSITNETITDKPAIKLTPPPLILDATGAAKTKVLTVASTANIAVGGAVIGPHIKAGTVVTKINSPTEVEISNETESELEEQFKLEARFTRGTKFVKLPTFNIKTGYKVTGGFIKAGTTVATIVKEGEIELSEVTEGAGFISETLTFTHPFAAISFSFTPGTTDQVLIDLTTPHRVVYYPGGIAKNEPQNAMNWIDGATTTWWDFLPEENELSFVSEDVEETGGTCKVQWAPANEV